MGERFLDNVANMVVKISFEFAQAHSIIACTRSISFFLAKDVWSTVTQKKKVQREYPNGYQLRRLMGRWWRYLKYGSSVISLKVSLLVLEYHIDQKIMRRCVNPNKHVSQPHVDKKRIREVWQSLKQIDCAVFVGVWEKIKFCLVCQCVGDFGQFTFVRVTETL